ncbi:MAG: hypothetical protein RL885_22790 [Planctomycetota bacterium]
MGSRTLPRDEEPVSRATPHTRSLRVVAALLLLTSLAGCFEYDENIVLHDDGTGYIDVAYFVPRALSIADWMTPSQTLALPVDRRGVEELIDSDDLRVERITLASTQSGTRVSFRILFDDLEAFFEVDVVPNQFFDFEEDSNGNWNISRSLVGIGQFRKKLEGMKIPQGWVDLALRGGFLRFRFESGVALLDANSDEWTPSSAQWRFPLERIPEDVVMTVRLENPLRLLRLVPMGGGILLGGALLVWIVWRRRRRLSSPSAVAPSSD